MNRFVVRVIGPSGMQRYLAKGHHEVEHSADATKYSELEDAEEAAAEFARLARFRWQLPPITDVVNLND
jgi:hypothetical protein